MKISYNWLKEYVNFNESPSDLAEILTLSSVPVESINSEIDNKVITAKIVDIKPHPNADRLQIAMVNNAKNILQVVCGAKNIKVGQIVPLAQIGASVVDITIKEAEIRGVKSSGMLCSNKELGLIGDNSGIKILPQNYEVGVALNKILDCNAVLDVEITPNRGDCLSHIGVAREVAAIRNIKIIIPEIINNYHNNPISEFNVNIEATDLCRQYYTLEIKNIKILPSPNWLVKRLKEVNIRPINNIVDITNYVMMEIGQPLHAFDSDKISNKNIIIRESGEMEKITTIDKIDRIIPSSTLVISDEDKVLAIAGVMGGSSSEISEKSKNIILESADFVEKYVRKASKNMNLSTEASYRFERGIDQGKVEYAISRAADLIIKTGGGIPYKIICQGKLPPVKNICIEYNNINKSLNMKLNKQTIDRILCKLGFKINNSNARIPLWRHDINVWQDLIEEIGRIYGYSKIKLSKIKHVFGPTESEYCKKEYIKDLLVDLGFCEVYNYPYLSEKDIANANIDPENLLEIANPIQKENKYLRNSLIPGLLKNIARNPSFDPVSIFELGKLFTKKNESCYLGLAVSGKDSNLIFNSAITKLKHHINFDSKSIKIFKYDRKQLLSYKIKKPFVNIVEINLDKIINKFKNIDNYKLDNSLIEYTKVSAFPPIIRDLAFIVDNDIKSDRILKSIKDVSSKIFLVELFDEYNSDKLGLNKKSIAYHIWMQDINSAMKDEDANEIVHDIINNLENKYQAKLRGGK